MEKMNVDKQKMIFTGLAIFLPLITAGLIALFYFMQTGTGLPMPKWNDEGAYYELVKTWLATGQPLGYWGFDGGHALMGTASAWSSAIVVPYALFGMMFGWNYSSVFFANTCFLILANITFILLVKPEKKNLVRVILLQALSVITILYSTTIMSEPFRYALAIVLAGMFYHLFFHETSKGFRYILLPLLILATVQIYIFMVFSVPLYIFGIMRGKKPAVWVKAVIAFTATAIVGGGSYYILHLISSNYNIYKTERLLEALKSFDFGMIIRSLAWMVWEGLHGIWSCFISNIGHGMFHWYVPFVCLMVVLPLLFVLIGKKWDKDEMIFLQVGFSVALFTAAYITVYSLEAFTFFRGVGIVLIFGLYLFTLLDKGKLFYLFLGLYALGMLFLPANMKDFCEERYLTAEEKNTWEELARDLEEVIVLDEQKDPWDNTVVLFTLEPKVIASIPAGAGVNMMRYSDEIPLEARYLLFPTKTENLRSDWLEHDFSIIREKYGELLDNNYKILYQNDNYLVYVKSK